MAKRVSRLEAARAAGQLELFEPAPPRSALPEGFVYAEAMLSAGEEGALAAEIALLELKPFEYRGHLGKRRVASFGWRYDFNDRALGPAAELPDFLHPLRAKAARFAGIAPEEFEHALVTEYAPGAEIGWHRDRPDFGDVVGVSLLAPSTFRFRRREGEGWERAALVVAPRSAYLLRGPARTLWEHSIPAVAALRYSVTFRTLRAKPARLR
jgi:alkylated DNA repair dioxygenase AlkB